MKIVVITGEESGDYLGAALLSALEKFYDQKLDIYGIGGKALKNKGMKNFYDISEINVMGIDRPKWLDTKSRSHLGVRSGSDRCHRCQKGVQIGVR